MRRDSFLRRAAALLLTGLISVQPVAAQVGKAALIRPVPAVSFAPVMVVGGPSLTAPSLAALSLPSPSALIPSLSPGISLPVNSIRAAPSRAVAAAALLRTRAAASSGSAPVGAPPAEAPISAEASAVRAAEIFDAAGAREALESAAQDDYTVTVLARRTETGRQLVVLLGEGHVKSAETARAGRRVLDRFKDYALEGYDTNSSLAGRLFWWWETKARAVTTATLPGGANAGSTIKEAARLVAADSSLRRYDLETGHKPGLAEKLGLLSPFVKMAVPLALIGSLLSVPFVGGAMTALAASSIAAGYTFLGAVLPQKWLNGRALGVLFPLETGIVRGRDKTMARAVAGVAAAAPLLAVIGRDHAPGMAKILTGKYGFQAATLDALQDESLPGPARPGFLTPVVRAAFADAAKRLAFAAGLGALSLTIWGGVSAAAAALGYAAHSSYRLAFGSGQDFVGLVMLCVVIAPFIEECMFRAGLFDGLRRGLLRTRAPGVAAAVAAAVVSAVIFAAFHELADPLFFGLHAMQGLLFALAYRRAGLAGSTLTHTINNIGFILSGSALVLSSSITVAAAVLASIWGVMLLAGKLSVKPQAGWALGSVWEADWGGDAPPAPRRPDPPAQSPL